MGFTTTLKEEVARRKILKKTCDYMSTLNIERNNGYCYVISIEIMVA